MRYDEPTLESELPLVTVARGKYYKFNRFMVFFKHLLHSFPYGIGPTIPNFNAAISYLTVRIIHTSVQNYELFFEHVQNMAETLNSQDNRHRKITTAFPLHNKKELAQFFQDVILKNRNLYIPAYYSQITGMEFLQSLYKNQRHENYQKFVELFYAEFLHRILQIKVDKAKVNPRRICWHNRNWIKINWPKYF